jgi:preprotein translocase subunit SecE
MRIPHSRYLQEVWAEFRRVVWPTRSQTARMTLQVIGVSLLVAAVVGGIDYLFTQGVEALLK